MLAVRQPGGGKGATFLLQFPELALPEAPASGRSLPVGTGGRRQ